MDEKKKYKKKRQQCHLCSKNYSKRDYLAKHMTQEHAIELEPKPPGRQPAYKVGDKNDPRPFKCPDCIKEYKKSKHLARHRREGHAQKMCKECKKSFPNIAQHMITAHGIELPKNFACEVCEKAFLTKSHLQSHMRVHRVVSRDFHCSVCGKSFGFGNDLRKHMRTHSLDRSILCDICGDAFKSQDTLKSHMRRHTGERPYKCALCSKAFSTSNSLDIHNRTHTGEKPYTCDYCQKGFSDPSTLTVHKRLHTNENPFICHLCGKTTKQASNLRSHYKHMHKNDVISGRQIRLNSRVFARYSKQEIGMHLQSSGNLITLLEQGLREHRKEETEKKQQIESVLQTLRPPPVDDVPISNEEILPVQKVETQLLESEESDLDERWDSECDDDGEDIKMPLAEAELSIQDVDETMAKHDTSMMEPGLSTSPATELLEINAPTMDLSEAAPTRSSRRIAIRATNTTTNPKGRPKKVEPTTNDKKSKKPSSSRTDANREHMDDVKPQIESVFIENLLSDSLDSLDVEVKKEMEEVTVSNSHVQSDDEFWTNMYDERFDVKEEMDEDVASERNGTTETQTTRIERLCSVSAERRATVKSEVTTEGTEPALLEALAMPTTSSEAIMKTPTITTSPLATITKESTSPDDSPIKYKNITGRCVQCNRKFNDITRHHAEMHSDIDKPFECFDCRKTYKKLEHLKSHMVIHTNERNFICHVCGQAFFLGSELRKHIFNRHQNVRPYGCDQCKKTFKSRHALNKHSVVHSGVKPYVCSVCSERYAALSSLRIHERRHTGAKPFVCSYCGKAFADSSTHRQHVRIHTGEKPYVCKLCGRACAQAGNLKSHYRHYHKVIVRNVSMFQENDFPVFERLPASAFDRYGGSGENRIEE